MLVKHTHVPKKSSYCCVLYHSILTIYCMVLDWGNMKELVFWRPSNTNSVAMVTVGRKSNNSNIWGRTEKITIATFEWELTRENISAQFWNCSTKDNSLRWTGNKLLKHNIWATDFVFKLHSLTCCYGYCYRKYGQKVKIIYFHYIVRCFSYYMHI